MRLAPRRQGVQATPQGGSLLCALVKCALVETRSQKGLPQKYRADIFFLVIIIFVIYPFLICQFHICYFLEEKVLTSFWFLLISVHPKKGGHYNESTSLLQPT